jgi:hypothetical protein
MSDFSSGGNAMDEDRSFPSAYGEDDTLKSKWAWSLRMGLSDQVHKKYLLVKLAQLLTCFFLLLAWPALHVMPLLKKNALSH